MSDAVLGEIFVCDYVFSVIALCLAALAIEDRGRRVQRERRRGSCAGVIQHLWMCGGRGRDTHTQPGLLPICTAFAHGSSLVSRAQVACLRCACAAAAGSVASDRRDRVVALGRRDQSDLRRAPIEQAEGGAEAALRAD